MSNGGFARLARVAAKTTVSSGEHASKRRGFSCLMERSAQGFNPPIYDLVTEIYELLTYICPGFWRGGVGCTDTGGSSEKKYGGRYAQERGASSNMSLRMHR